MIQDEELIDKVMRRYEPQVVFHAAAYKHVPMLERNPWQAVTVTHPEVTRYFMTIPEAAQLIGVTH